MARQEGFEPATYGLEGRCSIRLSYWRAWGDVQDGEGGMGLLPMRPFSARQLFHIGPSRVKLFSGFRQCVG